MFFRVILSLFVILILHASPTTVNWFKSYLSGRYQYVRIASTHSDTLPITHSVPQGAILSPLLFRIYLNDLPLVPSSCNLESYVDDSKLFLSFPLIELDEAIEKLEQDLLSVAQWCCENHLLINPDVKQATTESQHVISRRDMKTCRLSQGLGSHFRSSLDLRPSYFKNSFSLLF